MFRSIADGARAQLSKLQSGKAGAAGIAVMGVAAAAAAVGGVQLITGNHGDRETPVRIVEDRSEICLIGAVALVKGAGAGCYARATLAALQESAVIDASGEDVVLTLAHPTDDLAPVAVVRTCEAFRDYKKKGWYAFSSREMRREAAFTRACGALGMLIDSRTPKQSHFERGRLSASDIDKLVAQKPIGITGGVAMTAAKASAAAEGAPDKLTNEAGAPISGAWRVAGDGQTAALQEIAHADFTGDGYGDILLFVAIGANEATASAAFLSLVEKTSASSGPVMTVVDPDASL